MNVSIGEIELLKKLIHNGYLFKKAFIYTDKRPAVVQTTNNAYFYILVLLDITTFDSENTGMCVKVNGFNADGELGAHLAA